MKHFYLLFLLITTLGFSQIPSNYYDTANGLSGFALKTELRNITTNGHFWSTSNPDSYDELYTAYVNTHSDVNVSSGNIYENDGTVLDFYSENPSGADPYNYTHGNMQCGNQSAEGDCYNREHLVPQSSFNSAYPMQSDIHHVIPTDGRVNNFRGSLPFGEVATPNFTSLNGSKRGSSAITGYSGTMFEPIDEFKGDIARALLYFATRYENTVDGYTSFDMFNGTNNQVFFGWAIDMLLDWHYNVDPVDQRERDRNNAAYNFQGNANPFVDHPEYANLIWNPSSDTQAPTTPTNLVASNPTSSTVDLSWTASTDNVAVVTYDIYVDGSFYITTNSTTPSFTVTGLSPETSYTFAVLAKDAAGNSSAQSASASSTTTAGPPVGSDCVSEDFEGIPANSGSYSTRIWTGVDGITNGWTATDARTDQTLNGRSICIRNGNLSSPTIVGGIGNLTVTTQLTFGGSAGTFDVLVNGSSVGSIPYSGDNSMPTTTTIPNINISGDITLVLDNQSTSNRVRIDDLSWTCYSETLSNSNINSIEDLKLFPNPTKGNYITIAYNKDITVEIYDVLGKRVKVAYLHSSIKQIPINNLRKGIYLLKISDGNSSITKKLIKQ
ncbi:putative secreted protein (Por secretion system target) [Winogradskyella wandonensis]|uniref:Putative secreted protein (Por secretion system target) n=1 Tax=Winogradskyella wandonensis TaxID=1442586 RepID=A0A4R1KUN8_9FLAO|nr:endonuclease [Winogradskyella wandonensis]TCK68905.1 putative secreted protein (Por secretion system target) [Winogradskyella wandonensis]